MKRSAYRRFMDGLRSALMYIAIAIVCALLVGVIGYIFVRGIPHISWEFLSTKPSPRSGTIGILPDLLNTLYIILMTIVIVLPLGVGAAIYLTEYAKNKKLVRVIEFATETLSGIPSIIFGLVGMLVFVEFFGLQSSLIAGALTLVILVFTFLFRVVTVTGESMLPNFVEGQKLIVTNLGHSVEQGTVVVITNVLNEPIIKRVIATEGQTVDIDYETGVVYVDGEAVDETQFGLENGITTRPYSTLEAMVFPQTVPEGCVFVLGDNRGVSKDSRYTEVGMVDTRHILGEAVFTLYPFDRFGVIE